MAKARSACARLGSELSTCGEEEEDAPLLSYLH